MRICLCTVGTSADNLSKQTEFRELAALDTVGTHQLEDDPARADALLFTDVHHHYDRSLLPVIRTHELVRRFPDKSYVYDERDLPIFSLPGVYVSAPLRTLHRREMLAGPYSFVHNPVPPALREPDLLFSFKGADCHRVRTAVLALRDPRGVVRDNEGVDFFRKHETTPDRIAEARTDYAELIHRSKFVLCPRGRGPTSFRLFETMGAGRVPVIVSDGWRPPPWIDWERCTVRVAERDVAEIPARLAQLEPQWPEIAAAVREEYARHFAPDRLWDYFGTVLAQLARSRPPVRPPVWLQEEVARSAVRSVRARWRRRG